MVGYLYIYIHMVNIDEIITICNMYFEKQKAITTVI